LDSKYKLFIHKVDLKSDQPFEKLVHWDKGQVNRSNYCFYQGSSSGYTSYYYLPSDNILVDNFFLSYSDSLISSVSLGDSILLFDLSTRAISYRYEPSGDVNFCLLPSDDVSDISPRCIMHLNVALYKKNKSVFIMMIYPYGIHPKMPNDILKDILGVKSIL
jgi:hypothetical protein